MKLLIINHHYVSPKKYKNGIYPISPENFENNIFKLINKGWKNLNPYELLTNSFLNKKGNYFFISFDDGLKCQFKYAQPILEKHGIKGLYFIPTQIFEKKPINVHLIQFIRSKLDDKTINKLLSDYFKDLQNVNVDNDILLAQYPYDEIEAARLKYILNFLLNDELKESFVNHVFNDIEHHDCFFSNTYMSADETRLLAKKAYIGSHGHIHKPLSTFIEDDLNEELNKSINLLKEKCKLSKVEMISYPYGGQTAVSNNVTRNAILLGFCFGFTMNRGINNLNDIVNTPLSLKRISVNDIDDWI